MDKNILKSKTFWVNILMAVSVMFPAVQAFIASNPDIFTWVFVGLNLVLRLVTKGAVQIV